MNEGANLESILTSEKIKNVESVINAIIHFETNYSLQSTHPVYFQLCEKYKQSLSGLLDKAETFRNVFTPGEIYIRQHILIDNTEITFSWFIPTLEELISKQKLTPKKMKIGPLIKWIDQNGLEQHRLEHALQNNRPVYVIDYAPSNLEILIDGNHRVASRYMRYRDKDTTISGYQIPAKIHVRALSSDFQRALYKILSNVGRMITYLDKVKQNGKGTKPDLFNIDYLLNE